jgi:hypothetical protein
MRVLPLVILLVLLLVAGRVTDSPHGSELKISCSDCHSPEGWKLDREIYSFDHNTTGLPLEGQHTSVNCRLCHPTLVFSEAETDCFSCHTDMHDQTVGLDCARCHTPVSWIVQNITEIHQQGRFPLQGAHFMANCLECHPSSSMLRFEPLGVECMDCHMQDYQAAANPNHVSGNFSTQCIDCHTMTGFDWGGTGFDHSIFPLTDGHALSDCNLCHKGTDYADISPECYSCHQDDYQTTVNPGHVLADLSTNCEECHTTHPGWTPAQFDHSFFALTLGHAILDCSRCHDINDYNNISTECQSCHLIDYNSTSNPNHLVAEISTECMECHTTMPGWKPAEFEHFTFPLTQGHAIMDCNQCHDVNDYSNVTNECQSCHLPDYNNTTNPNHLVANLSTDCMECHTTMPGWKPAEFDHFSFPLTQGHAITDCNECHDVNDYSNIAAECQSCHLPDYNNTTNPNHQAANLSIDCMECHTTMPGWKPAIFDHFDFPLTQGHAIVDCSRCHDVNDYNNVASECQSCHLPDYNNTTNPNHLTANLPTDCMLCHTTMPGWKPATFDHSSFPLTQGHSIADCSQCHDANDYSNVTSECQSCHLPDYNNTTNPNHLAANLSIDCMECHTTMPGWKPAEFPVHDAQFFPIFSGRHRETWNDCSECHSNPSSYAQFSCLDCHEHNRTAMDDKHSGENGYEYNSLACLDCHPTGRAD